MQRVFISPAAQRDIEGLLARSQEDFGERARGRYEALLRRAIQDVVDDPERTGSDSREELAAGTRAYHIYYSRTHVAGRIGRVRKPRHILFYRQSGDGRIEILRVLHDSMDFSQHLPDDFS